MFGELFSIKKYFQAGRSWSTTRCNRTPLGEDCYLVGNCQHQPKYSFPPERRESLSYIREWDSYSFFPTCTDVPNSLLNSARLSNKHDDIRTTRHRDGREKLLRFSCSSNQREMLLRTNVPASQPTLAEAGREQRAQDLRKQKQMCIRWSEQQAERIARHRIMNSTGISKSRFRRCVGLRPPRPVLNVAVHPAKARSSFSKPKSIEWPK